MGKTRMSRPLEEALKAVARLRGDPVLDAASWRIILDALSGEPDRPDAGGVEDALDREDG